MHRFSTSGSGQFYLALNFPHDGKPGYTISAPSNATAAPVIPAPVPLPASVLPLGAGAAALGALGFRGRSGRGAPAR